jgi:hypothetical protein
VLLVFHSLVTPLGSVRHNLVDLLVRLTLLAAEASLTIRQVLSLQKFCIDQEYREGYHEGADDGQPNDQEVPSLHS